MLPIKWPDLERRLFDLTVKEIKRFASKHSAETFYGFAFDCNSEYGRILLCLNTPESLRQRAIEYATNPPLQAAFDQIRRNIEEKLGKKIFGEREPTTPEQEEQKLRWSFGDWKYQGFASADFEGVKDACMEEEQDEDTFMRPTQVRFMQAACRVMVLLEAANAFQPLRRTPDFKTYVADHDEGEEDSWARLEAARNERKQT